MPMVNGKKFAYTAKGKAAAKAAAMGVAAGVAAAKQAAKPAKNKGITSSQKAAEMQASKPPKSAGPMKITKGGTPHQPIPRASTTKAVKKK